MNLELASEKIAEKLNLKVVDWSRGGPGVSRHESGPVVFLPGTLPGEEVEAEIIQKKKKYWTGRVISVQSPSRYRIKPSCQYFGSCGGCEWQHTSYDQQWDRKTKGVHEALERARFGYEMPQFDLFPSESPFRYRNRIQLHWQNSKLGFLKSGSSEMVEVDSCQIADQRISDAIPTLKSIFSESSKPDGVYEIRVTRSGEIKISNRFDESFVQVNDSQSQNLREWIQNGIEPQVKVLDLYSGDGNLTRKLNNPVTCVDLNAPDSKSKKNLQFYSMSVSNWLKRKRAEKDRFHTIILDPPRSGLKSVMKNLDSYLSKVQAQSIYLIGCHTDAWIRDLKNLESHGWTVSSGAILDFFPQTHHVETVAKLVRL